MYETISQLLLVLISVFAVRDGALSKSLLLSSSVDTAISQDLILVAQGILIFLPGVVAAFRLCHWVVLFLYPVLGGFFLRCRIFSMSAHSIRYTAPNHEEQVSSNTLASSIQ